MNFLKSIFKPIRVLSMLMIIVMCIGTGSYASAGKKAIIKIYTNPATKSFKSLKKPVRIKTGYDGEELYEKLRFVSTVKGTTVRLESGELNIYTNKFKREKTLFTLKPKKNKSYEFNTVLSEGVPNTRLTVIYKGKKASWYLTYDGRGDRDVVTLKL